jgi:Xaa-Pro aminopeptidase
MELLSAGERTWLDAYHARVRETLTPLLDGETLGWLENATAPLG